MKGKLKRSKRKNTVATSEVGAPTTNRYGGGGSKGRKNVRPEPIVNKS